MAAFCGSLQPLRPQMLHQGLQRSQPRSLCSRSCIRAGPAAACAAHLGVQALVDNLGRKPPKLVAVVLGEFAAPQLLVDGLLLERRELPPDLVPEQVCGPAPGSPAQRLEGVPRPMLASGQEQRRRAAAAQGRRRPGLAGPTIRALDGGRVRHAWHSPGTALAWPSYFRLEKVVPGCWRCLLAVLPGASCWQGLGPEPVADWLKDAA